MINLICIILIYIAISYLLYFGIRYNKIILLCSSILLIVHLYKDITKLKVWPTWTEYLALLTSSIFIFQGYKSNIVIFIMGIIMMLGHSRQLIFNDNKYYIP